MRLKHGSSIMDSKRKQLGNNSDRMEKYHTSPFFWRIIMTIRKINTGKYEGKWQVRIQPMNSVTKKRINVSPQYASTKREATKIEHKMWNEYNSGFDFEISKHKFTE